MTNKELLFQHPYDFDSEQSRRSTLHVLRRDLLTCLGINPNNGLKLQNQQTLYYPAAMCVCAGIDLLGKFIYGDAGTSNKRFKDYLELCCQLQTDECSILYQLRNSLLHSYGMYSIDGKEIEYFFTVEYSDDERFICSQGNNHTVNLKKLHNLFESSILRAKESINHEHFNEMFNKYGVLHFR